MAYIRHRSRMVRQSVFEDLRRVLGELGWIGATPMAMLGSNPLVLIDYFPENFAERGEQIALNTLAIDAGRPSEPELYELGGGMYQQEYQFNFAFFSASDGIALALFQDLTDRYKGFSEDAYVPLFNYLQATPTHVVDMEVDGFRFVKSVDQPVPDVQLYYGELTVTDYLEQPVYSGA